jgi:hypothetical protein
MNLTSFSFTIFITSATVLAAIRISWVEIVVRLTGRGCRFHAIGTDWPATAKPWIVREVEPLSTGRRPHLHGALAH